jgi:hypothetical protein
LATVGPGVARADLADVLGLDPEEQSKLDDPLVEKRLPVDEDERARPPGGDEARADHRLADLRWGDEHARVVGEQRRAAP